MKYAVIATGGKQYKVSEGDIIDVDKLGLKKDEKVNFQVQLVVNDEKVEIGKPYLTDAKVIARVLEEFKGKKIRVSKFKSKVRVRRVNGFRAELTKIQIEKIETGKAEKITVKSKEKASEKVKK